jgi:hypothetical protein
MTFALKTVVYRFRWKTPGWAVCHCDARGVPCGRRSGGTGLARGPGVQLRSEALQNFGFLGTLW